MLIHCVDLYIGSTFQKRKQWNLFYQNFFVKLTVEPFILWYALFVFVSWSGCWMFSVFWVWSIFPCIFWVWSRLSCINKSILSVCAFVSSSPLKSANLPSFLFLGDFPFSRTPPPTPQVFENLNGGSTQLPQQKGGGRCTIWHLSQHLLVILTEIFQSIV